MAYYHFLPSRGGIENHIFFVSKELSKSRHKVTIITTNLVKFHSKSLPTTETVDGVHILRLWSFAIRDWIPVCPVAFFKKLPKCDILHLHSLNPNLFMLPIQIRGHVENVPTVLTPHLHPDRLFASYHHPLYRSYLWKVVPALLRKVDGVIALTPAERKYYEKCDVRRVFEIPNGVDLELHKTDPARLASFATNHDPEKRKILFVGRMTALKGLQTIIRCLPSIIKLHHDVIIYAVGAYTEYAEYLQMLAKNLRCEKHIRFYFDVPNEDLAYFYEISDLVVLPSIQVEAFGLVVLESWAHRKPVLVPNRGGMRDLVSQGGGKIVYSFGAAAWGQAIVELLEAGSGLARLGSEGRKLVEEKYNWKHVTQEIERVYRSILN